MAASVPTHIETSNNKSGFGSIQVNAPITGGTSAPGAERTRVRNELLAKIGPPNAELRPAQGTCEWILKDEKFQSWRVSCDNHLLWISGRPGKGKSHLAAFLGEQLSHRTAESSHSPLVLKFSCKNTDIRQSTSLAVHLNVLHQILQFCRSDEALHEKASSILNDIHTKLNSNLPRDDLWGIIKEFVNRDINTDHLTYFILDGLDECDAESIDDLSKKLQHLCSTTCRQGRPHFNAILLSRPLATISNRDLRIDLDDGEQYGAQILHEIRLFIDDKMGSSPIFETRTDELEILKTTLVERSNKTFLWVSLALELLKSHPSDLAAIVAGQGQDALDRLLPVGLPSMYNRMLLEALRGKYDGQRNFNPRACTKMIQFICVAFRPLTLAELQGAVDLSLEASAVIGYCKHILVQCSDETVYEHTGEVFEGNPDQMPGDKTFQLVHLSLKEYLQQPRRFIFPAPLGLLLLPYLSFIVATLRAAIHSFYYLDLILFVAIFLSLDGVFKSHRVAGFVSVALCASGLINRWKQKKSWILQVMLKLFASLLDLCVLGAFAAPERSCHRDLFVRSLAFLMDKKAGLKREAMENLVAKGALSAKKPMSVDAKLPPFGRYACRFWAQHLYCLYEVDWTPQEEIRYGKSVLQFLKTHLLDWLRSLSLKDNLGDGVLSVKRLVQIFNNLQGGNRELDPFLKDAERFMMQFFPIIERAPFQVYGSALAFCPNNSIVRSTFWDRVLPFAKKIKSPHDDWSPILQALEGHKSDITSVAFSKDGKLIASRSGPEKIHLWDTETGRLKRMVGIENGRLEIPTFSPRGQLIASGQQSSANGERKNMIWVWDEQTGELLRSIDTALNLDTCSPNDDDPDDDDLAALTRWLWPLDAIACSPDGDVLAAVTPTSIQLWHLESETILREIPIRGNNRISSIAFSPDGYLIASMSKRVLIWKVETGQLEFTIVRDDFPVNEDWHPGQGARLDSLAFSDKGSGSGHGVLQLWDPTTGKPSKELLKHCGTKTYVAFSPDGTMVASGYGPSLLLWDSTSRPLPSEQPLRQRSPLGAISWMIVSSDKRILAALSGDFTMNIWNLKAGTLVPLEARIPRVFTFAFSPQCDILAFTSFGDDLTLRLWSVTEGKEAHVLDQLGGRPMKLHFSSDGNTLAVFVNGCVHLLDPATGATRLVLESPSSSSQCLSHRNDPLDLLSFCPKTGSVAFSTGQHKEQTIEIWDPKLAGGSYVHLEGSTGHIYKTSFSPDGTKIAVSYIGNKTTRVWDTETGQLNATIESPLGPMTAMGFSPDSRLLMLSADSSPVQIWDLGDSTFTETVQVTKGFCSLALSDCGNYLTTNRGVMDIGHNSSRRGFYVDGGWIVRGQEEVLWLPYDMRANQAILVDDLLILGCISASVELVLFCEEKEEGYSS